MLPNLFLAGAARAGTTSLWRHLTAHDGVFFPSLKEPKYFSAPDNVFPHAGPGDAAVDARVVHDPAEYERLFDDHDGASVVGDASVDAMYFPGAPNRMRHACPEARVLVLLRDPVARAFSAYRYLVLSGRESLSFEEALEREPDRIRDNWEFIWHYRRAGEYAEQVDRVLRSFGRDRVHVIDFDALRRDAATALAPLLADFHLAARLGANFPRHEASAIPANPILRALVVRTRWHGRVQARLPATYARLQHIIQTHAAEGVALAPGTRAMLESAFDPDRRSLEAILGRRLAWWKPRAA